MRIYLLKTAAKLNASKISNKKQIQIKFAFQSRNGFIGFLFDLYNMGTFVYSFTKK